jgi:hypothetical protein
LAQLRAADSTVCELAGRSLTNFGGWGWFDGVDNPPMPTPTLACWALGEIEDERGVMPLLPALKDSE